jgi:hypothetical protein
MTKVSVLQIHNVYQYVKKGVVSIIDLTSKTISDNFQKSEVELNG